MTAEHEQNDHVPDNNEHDSQFPERKEGEAIAENFRRHSMALLSTLQALAQVCENEMDNIGENVDATGLEETQYNLSESCDLSTEDHIKRLKVSLEAPTLIERIRARIQEYERIKINSLLRQFGQEHHTSIN